MFIHVIELAKGSLLQVRALNALSVVVMHQADLADSPVVQLSSFLSFWTFVHLQLSPNVLNKFEFTTSGSSL